MCRGGLGWPIISIEVWVSIVIDGFIVFVVTHPLIFNWPNVSVWFLGSQTSQPQPKLGVKPREVGQ